MITYKHADRKHSYYEVKSSEPFTLCQVGGSLSSIISFADKEDASTQGWYIVEIHKAWVVLDEFNKAIAYLDESLGENLETSKAFHKREGYRIIELTGKIK